jgi:hypothetical protein
MAQAPPLTPLTLAVPPSGTHEVASQPPYNPERQYAVDHTTIWTVPTMGRTTQTFDARGQPSDSDQD